MAADDGTTCAIVAGIDDVPAVLGGGSGEADVDAVIGLSGAFGVDGCENSWDQRSERKGMDVAVVLGPCMEPAGADMMLAVDGFRVDGDSGMTAGSVE